MRKLANLVGIVGILAFSVPVFAAAADTIRARIASYRELGAAFKAANDGLRGEPQTVLLQQAARQISNASKQQYAWFPAGSGTGAKTAAKAEIWSNAAGFRTAQDNFARQAEVFRMAVASGNAAAIRVEVRKLGAACKGCHDQFRSKDD